MVRGAYPTRLFQGGECRIVEIGSHVKAQPLTCFELSHNSEVRGCFNFDYIWSHLLLLNVVDRF